MVLSTLSAKMCDRVLGALALYLAQPIRRSGEAVTGNEQWLAAILNPGDVLLSDGNTRVAALVKRVTRSTWSHVSMYVGPLEPGPDPRCIVEAHIVDGVRAIRLSELGALQVRVLRPIGLSAEHRRQLADWVVSRIGSEYDLAHAWFLGRRLLRLPLRPRSRTSGSTTRFICSSLLAHAFALVGRPIEPDAPRAGRTCASDHRNLIPADFERAPTFEMVGWN